MNKSGLFFVFVILCVYFTLVFCDESQTGLREVKDSAAVRTDLIEESRVRRKHGFHGLHHYWGWHALAIAYFIKIKVVIVAFFLGSAFFWGLRYFWPHKCHSEIVRESPPIVYDHPPPSFSHHDHIPYSFGHSGPYSENSYEATATFDTVSSNGPYSGYTGAYSETAPPTAAGEHRIKRSAVHRQQQYMPTEEQIAEFMFTFLGLDSQGCRRRFICEMEFRSKLNPLTSMAFRIVGRSFFGKYTNARNKNGKATSFLECAAVNPECTVIEENFNEQPAQEEDSQEEVEEEEEELLEHETHHIESDVNKTEGEAAVNSSENEINQNVMQANAADMERTNAANLWAERRASAQLKRRRRGRKADTIAASILNRAETQTTADEE